jgi:hypothetical protein
MLFFSSSTTTLGFDRGGFLGRAKAERHDDDDVARLGQLRGGPEDHNIPDPVSPARRRSPAGCRC